MRREEGEATKLASGKREEEQDQRVVCLYRKKPWELVKALPCSERNAKKFRKESLESKGLLALVYSALDPRKQDPWFGRRRERRRRNRQLSNYLAKQFFAQKSRQAKQQAQINAEIEALFGAKERVRYVEEVKNGNGDSVGARGEEEARGAQEADRAGQGGRGGKEAIQRGESVTGTKQEGEQVDSL